MLKGFKRGTFLDTGDYTSGNGAVADPQPGDDANLDNDVLDDNDLDGDVQVGENDVDPVGDDAGPADQQAQTPEANAAFAKMRRELEARDKWVAENFGASHGIYTFEQYTQAVEATMQRQQQQQYQQQRQELADQGYDLDAINKIMSMHPEFQAVKQQNAMLQQQLQKQQFEQRLVSEFEALKSEYPDLVKDPGDVTPEVWQRFEKGYSLVDAYTVVNKSKILQQTKAAAKQKALNNINGKSHLRTEGDGANNAVDVQLPAETLQMYMDMGMNKKQALAHYKKLYG